MAWAEMMEWLGLSWKKKYKLAIGILPLLSGDIQLIALLFPQRPDLFQFVTLSSGPAVHPAKMANDSTLSTDDKAKVKKAVPTSSSTNKIVTASVARVYQAKEGARSCVRSQRLAWHASADSLV